MLLLGQKKEETEIQKKLVNMAGIEEQSKIKKEGEIRYLSPLDINTSKTSKYCMFRRSGIKYAKPPIWNYWLPLRYMRDNRGG